MNAPLRVANASGFYGDRFSAVREMLTGGPIDVLTGDYLAELTMLILGRDRLKDPTSGYAKTFLRQMEECLGLALDAGMKVVTNAGGLNPAGLADALHELGERLGLAPRIAYVTGDDLTARAADFGTGAGTPLTANAYLGAFGIAAALRAGADLVVTGRVTDASLVVGPAAAHFGWTPHDLDRLAGAVAAGHVIECGAQATGGNYAFFTEHDVTRPGFPIAEVYADGSSVITKHPGTGGAVTVGTVTAQLLYEIDSPRYLGPDVTTRLDTVVLTDDGPDRVRISGVRGEPAPPTLKVGLNTLGGFRNDVTFILTGLDVEAKAALVRTQLEAALPRAPRELAWRLARTDHPDAPAQEEASALLHATLKDPDPKLAGRAFSGAAVELALASYPGFTLTTPPSDGTPYGVFTAVTVPAAEVPHVAVLPDGTTIHIPPAPTSATAPTPASATAPVSGTASAVGAASGLLALAEEPAPSALGRGPSTTESDNKVPFLTAGTRRGALGLVAGARSGDKGGSANIGVWVRADAAYAWLVATLTVDELRRLLPELGQLPVARYELPKLRAVNFVVDGLLGAGVSAGTRFDPQGKGLGEWLRSRYVDIPEELL
ncbi:acyclic terpene utilization AtuA family protein [Catellatospora tritici]|uniref:acyclic terpene utilization AtuA family protein n=1 Tax=Catellatospora tritici TaxID=2851566 RepID=UPI001C2DC1AF|nr:acyclic terpene utilization AtuA family protein [Catellatospora tritici]MBV1856237.1 acyclic terpene utilization AtuA family protein [Catellatospora tritici]